MDRVLRVLAVVSLLLSACGSGGPSSDARATGTDEALAGLKSTGPGRPDLTVMTRNLYLGADIMPIASAQTPEGLLAAATRFWRDVGRTNFPARAQAIADEIASARPDVLGLQEVSVYKYGPPAVCMGASPTEPTADVPVLDFLSVLQAALAERGMEYELAAQVTTLDVELCILDASVPEGVRDLRYTDLDVILVRHGVTWQDSPVPDPLPGFIPALVDLAPGDRNGAIFALAVDSGDPQNPIPATAFFPIPGFEQPIYSWRGWTAVEVERGGHWVRVFETHTEDRLDALAGLGLPTWFFQAWQDAQLVAAVDLLLMSESTALPTIVLGDFNVYRQPSEPRPPTYGYLVGDPFPLAPDFPFRSPLLDTWMALQPDDPGLTWGYDDLLHGGKLVTTLDLVLATPDLTPTFSYRVGVHTRAHGGLRPSDHAGLVTGFKLQ